MSTEAVEKLNIGQLYHEGDFIDARDNQGDWRVGYIVGKNQSTQLFKVRFDGWSSKYDEFIKFNSPKLKPFRTFVVGYTGQKQNPGLRDGWTFSVEKIKEKLKQLQSFKQNPRSLNVHQLNQFIRGHNYFFVDYLMTVKYPDSDSMGLMMSYFQLNIEIFISYLTLIIQTFSDYMKDISAGKEQEDMSETEAYYYSFYEIFDTAYIIFGNYERFEGFFKNNEDHLREILKCSLPKDIKKNYKKHVSEHLVSFKGTDAINTLLQIIAKKEDSVPFFFLSAFTHMLEGVLSLFLSTYREGVVETLLKIGDHNINKLKDTQIKELHRTDVSTFIQALMGLSRGTKYSESIEEWATMLQLSLSLKMILCPYFERKLKGISNIIEVCERHEILITKNDQFRVWINKSNLFDVLFQLNDNLQIIKKSCELTKFMVLRNLLKSEDVDIIWNSRVGKHETIVKQIYNLIGELPYYQKDVNQNLKFFRKVTEVPKDQWDEDYIHMIRQFSQNSYGFNTKEHMKETFGFQMIYEYAIATEKDFALNELVALMNYFQNSEVFNKFQQNCFVQISKGHKVKTYIKILLALNKENIETFIKLEVPLIKIVIDHLLVSSDSKDKEMITDSFELLSAVNKNTNQEIEIQLFITLWDRFMGSANKDLFIRWLYKKKDNGRVYLSSCLTGNIKKYLLVNLWKKDEDFRKITEEEAVLIVELFKYSNQSEHKLKKPHPMVMIVISHQLIGYDILLKVLKETQDDKAALLICDFLAEISTSYDEALIEEAITEHSKNLITCIKEAIDTHNMIYLVRLLTLFKKTIDFDDEIYPIKHQPRHQFPKEYTVIRKELGEELTLKFSCTSIYYDFKKHLSSKFSLPLHKFYLVNGKGIKLTRQHFYKTMIEPPMTGGKFQLLLKEEKSVIKNVFNKYLDIFFNLLDDARIEKLVWNIVERLPISEQLKEKVTQTDNIFYELEHVGFYKKLYMLKVMLELDEEWWLKLATSKSISDILDYFSKVTFKTQIEEDYVITLTDIINKILKISKVHPEVSIPKRLFSHIAPVLAQFFVVLEKEGSKNLQAEQKIVKNIFEVAENISDTQDAIKELISTPLTENLFNLGLIKIPNQEIRKKFTDQFKNLMKYWHPETDWQIVALLLSRIFENAISFKKKDNLREYFTLTSHMLSKCHITLLQELYKTEIHGLVLKLFTLIKHEKTEECNETINKALEGYLTLLKHLIILENQHIQNQVFSYLVNECLFSEHDPKCKSSPSRRESFNVLLELSQNQKNVEAILPYLTQMHKKGHWRSKRLQDWGITINDKSKSSTGYVGLKNLGCICYMNSFNQQLFMIPYFRYSITNADDATAGHIEPEDNVLYQVQKMFMNLEYSEKKYYNPRPFCNSFKDYEGNPTNVIQQMDIDEYSNILFDRLETYLKNTQYSSLIKDMFGGVFSNQIVCKGCPHYSESEEPFLSVSLTVKNKKNIYQSFETMIKGDTLDGDNAYFCERCSKKVSAVKRMSLKKLPNHLIVTLKRFQFDYERMMKLKVNDYCEFPLNLNLREYSQQYLRKQENSKTAQQEEEYSNDYFNYILKGFVVHVGHADSGHYYSFIQDRHTNKWHQFNDTSVKEFDIADLAEQAFGGETGGYDAREKIKNAYMVIYERQKKITIGNEIPFKREAIKRKEVNEKIIEEIMKENKEQKLQNILFSRQYTRYLLGMLTKSDKLDMEVEKKTLKYAIIFYLTITIREKNEGLNEFMLKRISKVIDKHVDLAEWTLDLFSNEKIYDQFFLHNLFRQTRKILAFWLIKLHKLCSPKVKINFLNSLINKVSSKSENYIDICLIIYEIALADKEMLTYLLKVNIIGRLIVNITREKDKFKEVLQVYETESEIGYEEQIEKSILEELKNKKLRLQESQNEYVWGLIALVIEHAHSHQTTLKDILPEEEFDCLELPQTKIYKILEELRTKFAIYSFVRYISYLTTNNQEFLKTLIQFIYTGLKDFQSKRYRQFMLLAEEISSIRDDFISLRLEGVNKIVDALKYNEQYSSDSNIIQQWLVILFNRNEHLRIYLMSEVEILDYLFTLTSKKVPSDQISKKNKKYNDAMVNKLHGVKFLYAKKGYLKLAEQIRNFYKMIIDNTFEPSEYWPCWQDNYMKERQIGDKVAYFDINDTLQYEEATIQSMALGKIELSQGKNKSFTVWMDDEKLLNEVPFELDCEYSEGSSSKNTEELLDEDQDYIDDI